MIGTTSAIVSELIVPAGIDGGEEEEGRVMDDDLFSSLQGLTENQVHTRVTHKITGHRTGTPHTTRLWVQAHV